MASAAAWAPPRSARHVRSLDAVVVDARAVRAAAEALGAEHGVALVNEDHGHGNTPLCEAARAGHEEMVK